MRGYSKRDWLVAISWFMAGLSLATLIAAISPEEEVALCSSQPADRPYQTELYAYSPPSLAAFLVGDGSILFSDEVKQEVIESSDKFGGIRTYLLPRLNLGIAVDQNLRVFRVYQRK